MFKSLPMYLEGQTFLLWKYVFSVSGFYEGMYLQKKDLRKEL